jgi:protein-L-isoaspartate(D-aspartate) O-methyltransferase
MPCICRHFVSGCQLQGIVLQIGKGISRSVAQVEDGVAGNMAVQRASLDEIRGFYAKLMAAASGSHDPRLERIFELVPREAFLPPGPWKIMVGETYVDTPSADPVYLYQNTLVALDAGKGINNGVPSLHAAWIGAASPQPGETVTHVGAGTGYYTAILSMLVLAGGQVHAFEIEERLAAAARRNLLPFENASVTAGNATSMALPASDLIYVNAGLGAPPVGWLRALRSGGRMIFPWRPSKSVGIAVLVTAKPSGFEVKPLMPAWFIPCIGAPEAAPGAAPLDGAAAWRSRSLRLTAQQAPDATATAVYAEVWFSSEPTPPT